ncbi:MAG: SPOR domain-containing protein, partial [Burkholderiaceae bacterium]
MAFFKLRKGGGDESASTRSQPESIEAMRRRARHRLIGAGVLVLIGVVGFPLLFDTQPRPISVDIPIDIPDRNKVKPLPVPALVVSSAPVAAGSVTAVEPPPAEKPKASPENVAASAPAPVTAKVETPPAPKVEAKAEP